MGCWGVGDVEVWRVGDVEVWRVGGVERMESRPCTPCILSHRGVLEKAGTTREPCSMQQRVLAQAAECARLRHGETEPCVVECGWWVG